LKQEETLEMQPKISIVIPAYNAEKYLSQCLDSIINQTLKDIEIICVNDGSTDRTGAILDRYKLMDDRIIVIHRENGGLSVARNTGIEAANGEYLGFVDSDDFVDEEMFESLYNSACRYDSDVVISNFHLFMDDTKKICPYRDIVRMYHLECEGSFNAKANTDIVKFIGAWDKLYRRSFIEQHKLRNPVNRIYEDALFTFQTLVLADRVSVVSNPLYYYRKNVNGAITDKEVKNDKYKNDFLLNLKDIRTFLEQQNSYPLFAKAFLQFAFEFALFHQNNITSKRFFKEFFNAMREITQVSDYATIQEHGLSRHRWYAQRLQNNELRECYYVLRKKRISIYDL